MYKGLRIAVVVPAHNEAKLISTTIASMPDLVDTIVVVDDASTDDTVAVALKVGDARVQLITHETNTGVGGAILDGHRRVLDLGADVSVVMAGDAQMDPVHLPALLDPIADDGVQFTKANRFFSRISYASMPTHRVVGNIALSFLTKAASGYWHLFDPQNGYTAIHRDALERLPFESISTGYDFENSLLINLNILRIRARDIPVPAVYGDAVSGMRMRRVIPIISRTLFRGFWRRMVLKYMVMSFSPVALLLLSGLVLVTIGTAAGIFVVVNSLGPPTASAGTVLLAVAPMLTGIHLLVNALLLDIQESPD